MPDRSKPKKARSPINAIKLINELREARGLPKVSKAKPRLTVPKVTRLDVRRICIDVWSQDYPRSLTDPEFALGELTVKLVEQEVARRAQILRGELVPYRRNLT